ncbi:MAG: Flp pilus assembly complex ATPase component TadA [Candidatus Omnitrophica bacterium]|nr:Flp pilus assembly complex ATPase component TadA [Candidatus Omnitrophota bacterium]
MNRSSRIISVFSSKGGVGKTIIAANLAVSFAQFGRKVALLDIDLQHGGDVAKMLNLKPSNTIFSLISYLPKLDKEGSIKKFLTHHYSGVDVLPAVSRPKEIPQITTERLQATFNLLRSEYEFIIVDAGSFFTDALIHIFDNSNLILLVATPDVLSVYQTEWSLDTMEGMHFPLNMVKLVLNRAESRGGVHGQDLRPALRCEVIASLPSDGRTAGISVNRGIPFVMEAPRSKISEAVKRMAEDLIAREDIYIEKLDRPQVAEKSAAHAGQFWERHGQKTPVEAPVDTDKDEIIQLKKAVHQRLIEELDLKRMDVVNVSRNPERAKHLRERTARAVSNILAEKAAGLISSYEVRKELVQEIVDEALGLGPLEDLLRDPEVTEVMVNNKDHVYVERHGKIELTSKKFISNEQVRAVIERIVAPLGRRIDESVPMVDARLPDGSRVNAIIPPLSLKGPTLTIRKFSRERYTTEDLVRFGTITPEMVDFLRVCVLLRKNMLISGGTGSGKTTLLNALSQFIPNRERIITIEDAAEVKLRQTHWISLEARMPNIEGKGGVSIRELFRNSLRMRPDRIIIGECRGNETPDMLQAMNTGHDGSLSTIHANSTHHVLARLDTMVLMSGIELPVRAIREQIAGAIHVIVHTARLSDGSRKVMCITEVSGLKGESNEIEMHDIFSFKQTGIDKENKVLGDYKTTGFVPSFTEDMKVKGIEFPIEIFKTARKLELPNHKTGS